MRILVYSDLHLEFGPWTPPPVDADVVVLAGDILKGDQGLHWARAQFASKSIVALAGNHEFYREEFHGALEACRTTSQELGIHFLDNGSATLGGVRFIGATLWTDFCLNGDGDVQKRSMTAADEGINDFRLIEWNDGKRKRRFEPRDAVALHQVSRDFIARELAKEFPGPTVVATHYLPCRDSIAEHYAGDPLNPAFCSDLSRIISATEPNLWIHGHTHESCDYRLGRTRIVCNPRGYFPAELNQAFDPSFVVEV